MRRNSNSQRYVRRSTRTIQPRNTSPYVSSVIGPAARRQNPLNVTGIEYKRIEVFQDVNGLRIASCELSVPSTRSRSRANKRFRVLLRPEDQTILVYGEIDTTAKIEGSHPGRVVRKIIEESDIRINSTGVYENGYPQSYFGELAHKFRLPDGCCIRLSQIMLHGRSSITVISSTANPPMAPGRGDLVINLFDDSRFYSCLTNGCVQVGVFGTSKARFSERIPFQTNENDVVNAGSLPSVVRTLKLFLHDEGRVTDVAVENSIELKVFSPHCHCDIYAFPECSDIRRTYHGPPGTSMPDSCKVRSSGNSSSPTSSLVVHLPNHGNSQQMLEALSAVTNQQARSRSWISQLAALSDLFDSSEIDLAIRASEAEAAASSERATIVFNDQESFTNFRTSEKPKFPIIKPTNNQTDTPCSICQDSPATYVASCQCRICCDDCVEAFRRAFDKCPYCREKIIVVVHNAPVAATSSCKE